MQSEGGGNNYMVVGSRSRRYPVLSVVIVNYNCGRYLCEAVRAVLRSTVSLELIISDNGSSDDSLAALRILTANDARVRVIENKKNLGFARATNIALKQASAEHFVLLNPDCIVQPRTLERLLEVLAIDPEAGMAGCLIRNPDGSEQGGCRRAIPTPWRSFVRVFHLNKLFPNHPRFRTFLLNETALPNKPTELEAISGALMVVRRSAVQQVGLLDEGYFLHCDDLDWCMRFRQAGWKILFVPDAEAVHYQGACSQNSTMRVLWHKHKGMIRFYRKFFRKRYPVPLMMAVMVAVWTRFALLSVRALFDSLQSGIKALVKPNAASSALLKAAIQADTQEYRKKSAAPTHSDEYAYERIGASERRHAYANNVTPDRRSVVRPGL